MKIYSDSLIEYEWFRNLHPELKTLKFELIQRRGKNIPLIEELIKYDRPDIILADEDKAYLVVEITREVPTGHNVGQRLARMIRALELRIPTLYFCPFKARKHGVYSSILNMNGRLFDAFIKMQNIHKTPIFLVNWKCDINGELINDGSENDENSEIINHLVENSFTFNKNFNIRKSDKLLENFKLSCENFPNYLTPPKSVEIFDTNELIESNKSFFKDQEIQKLKKYNQSVIYTIKMKQSSTAKRQDPYTGTQFLYDYLYCRNGVNVEDKEKNLILYFPLINKDFWKLTNPNISSNKSSNWYITANGLLFNDGYIFLR